ncbi:RlmE family RNA methyltransferase [Vulgatibacter incomptus]|uniref:Ribosomal RNA large subunit methyltransferase E n=1 Tax=Vulgatibacter incomptus TaxID=1391653 RepID=A0A0K1PAS3_9BACT|nr:RlmE family RNA methyltransferase [Vulgatibacter incomptus]AKU90625.1 Heat shock protein FtsJ/RrmJ [Vulgatibacter incomptus]
MTKSYNPKDPFFKKAKQEGLRARSAFKIQEIADRLKLYRKGMAILDLGAAPGGWLQILARIVGPSGKVVGIDLQPIRGMGPNVKTAVLDIYAPDLDEKLRELHDGAFDAITSDMAPKTTGIKATDEARSIALAEHALALCSRLLRPGGSFVAKVFEGSGFEDYLREAKKQFDQVKLIRPEATRGRSFEIYVVGIGFRAAQAPQAPAEPANG